MNEEFHKKLCEENKTVSVNPSYLTIFWSILISFVMLLLSVVQLCGVISNGAMCYALPILFILYAVGIVTIVINGIKNE